MIKYILRNINITKNDIQRIGYPRGEILSEISFFHLNWLYHTYQIPALCWKNKKKIWISVKIKYSNDSRPNKHDGTAWLSFSRGADLTSDIYRSQFFNHMMKWPYHLANWYIFCDSISLIDNFIGHTMITGVN